MAKRQSTVQIPGVAHAGGGVPGFIPFGTVIGDTLTSGATMGRDPTTGELGATPERQAELAFQNTRTLLDMAGFTPDDVAHMFVWFKDHRYRDAVNKPWVEMFPDPDSRPARHALIADLPGDMAIQLEITAVRGAGPEAKRQSLAIPGRMSHGATPIPVASKVGDWLFTGGMSGQGDPEQQAELAFQNLRAVLESAGYSTDDVGHLFVWYKDHKYRDVVNKPFVEMFPQQDNRPARHAIVRDLPGDVVLQIEAVALRGSRRQCFEIPGVSHGGGGGRGFIPFGTKVGNVLFSGATMGQDPATGKVAEGAERQAELAFQNTRTLLDTAGFTTDDVSHMFVWYKDHQYRDAVNKPWVEMFPDINNRPTRHAIVAGPTRRYGGPTGGHGCALNRPLRPWSHFCWAEPCFLGERRKALLTRGRLRG